MGAFFNRGFTIIETMLVLAITGVLVAALLVGVGTSVNIQRYRDSVTSLKSLVQDQYSRASNVSNDRTNNWSCNSSAQISQGGSTLPAGQSQCLLIGRYISIVDTNISMATVVGYQTSKNSATSDVAEIVNNYTLGISTSSIESNQLEWGAQIAWARTGTVDQRLAPAAVTPRSIAILIVRSPTSGTTYTFTDDNVVPIASVNNAKLKTMLIENTTTVPGQKERVVCIVPSGGIIVPEKIALYIAPSAQDQSAIETRTAAIFSSSGGATGTTGNSTQC